MKKLLDKGVSLIIILFMILSIVPGGVIANEINNENVVSTEATPSVEKQDMVVQNDDGNTLNTLAELPDPNQDENTQDQVVVIYAQSGENNIKDLALNQENIKSGEKVSDRVDVLEASDNISTDDLILKLKGNPNVLAVDRNSKIETTALPNDPYITNGYAWQFEKIGADKTWNSVSSTESIVVAVIDTGLNVQHPDLVGKTVKGHDYVTNKETVVDVSGHGTMVSGCIAAVANNGIGIAGVGGNLDIKIAPYRTGGESLNDTSLYTSYICAAIMDAADRTDVKVINMSFGGYDDYSPLQKAIEYAAKAGKILVASAGNEGNIAGTAGKYSYPASYDNVISVAAINDQNNRSNFSQYNDQVDLTAPGEAVYTTTNNGSYNFISGTSFSTPMVAGSCAVLLAADSNLTASGVENILKITALDLGNTGKDNYYGNGLIQLDKAIESITPINPIDAVSCLYRTHVQDVGWQDWSGNGQISGTSGKSLRLEAIEIKVDNQGYDIGVEYQTHVENIGWQGFKSNGGTSGITGQSLRLEAIQIRLTGADADKFDIYYQVHAENYDWLDWAKNGESAGTEGLAYRLEAIKIVMVPKGSVSPGATDRPFIKNIYCSYQTHIQNIGWQGWKSKGDISGTTGRALRLEGIEINTNDNENAGIEYQTQVQNIGWEEWKSNGVMSGIIGQSLRLEAIRIRLTGTDVSQYDIYYQVHAENYGWLDWAKNGESAGTEGFGYRLEAIRIVAIPKGSAAPGQTTRPFINNN
ncbi:MAG: S8 family serine peptidase [Eubacteriaceae bacterium]|nr:S8 family serine peptidase [Eubacteriaceae bacterium]